MNDSTEEPGHAPSVGSGAPPPATDEVYANLLTALQKLPRHVGISFRGHAEDEASLYPGRTLVTQYLTPTTKDLVIATRDGAVRSVFAVYGDGGSAVWQVSQAAHEREVVFLPSTLFVIGATEQVGPLRVTYVEQVNPDHTPEVAARLTPGWAREATHSMVEHMVSEAPVVATNPTKFIGPLE